MSDQPWLPPADWYPDPQAPGHQRYWDGAVWTEHRAPLVAAPPAGPPPPWVVPSTTLQPSPNAWVPVHQTPGNGYPAAFGATTGPQLSSVGRRFGAYLLDYLLSLVTLGIGWLIWFLVIADSGRSPGKSLMDMCCVDAATGQPLGFGRMMLRDVVGKLAISVAIYVTFGLGLPLVLWLLWDARNQQLWDKMATSVVVDVVPR